jgi:GNAT superfamily N-acetyltransferase
VPRRGVPAVVEALQERDPEPVGAQGPAAEAEAVAGAWAARTGATVAVGMRMRLFALDTLRPPDGVPGAARAVGSDDQAGIDRLAAWRAAFAAEHDGTGPHPRSPREDVVRALAGGAGELLWEVGGEPVAQAAVRAVVAGMSRIGPVYTPPAHRRGGYGAAVTAAAARWAQYRGARHVLLYTDLANPTTNRLYPRLGFRPRYDAVELRFAPAADRR